MEADEARAAPKSAEGGESLTAPAPPGPAGGAAAAPITHRRVLAVALPIVISNATVPILGAVDTGVIGQLGEAAPIGAVGIGAIILSSVYWLFGFLRMGTVGLAAQALGAGQREEVSAILSRALVLALLAGLAIIVLQAPLFALAFRLSPASADVESLARDYMAIRVLSAPAAIGIYAVTGWLIAQARTRAVLTIQLWTNGLNMALDLAFVLGLGWGVQGVALATFVSEWSGVVLGLWLCRDAFRLPAWRDAARVFDPGRLRRMAALNRDILLRSLMLQLIFASFLMAGGQFGDVTLAANQVLLQFLYITAYALDGFAFATEAFVGQALGARDRARLRRGALLSSAWGYAIVIVLSLCFALWGGAIVDLMARAPDVREAARQYLPWMVIAPFVGAAAWMLDGVFIGAAQGREMRNMMAISLAAYLAALWLLVPIMGNHGLWAALLVSFAVRAFTLGLRYPALERQADASAATSAPAG